MPLRIGDTFAGYRVLRQLGSGGMGEVYSVQHPRLPRQEALKVLRPEFSQDPSFRERFIREADLAAGLRHPHVVGIHDRGEHEGQLWITMDYIDGTDLRHLLERRYSEGMPVGHVLAVVTAVASALDYAHKKGLLHRDVKPANIIVADLDTDDPKISLADFGIARPLDDTSGITTTNMTVGTVAYAAPEQLMGEAMNGRADQYALAATTYHLLTGSQLFSNLNPAVVISRHLNASAPALGDARPELASLDHPLATALAKDPKDRFPRCVDFTHQLTEIAAAPDNRLHEAATIAAVAASRPQRTNAPNANLIRPGRRSWFAALAVVGVFLLVAALVLVWRPWRPTTSTEASGTQPAPTTTSTPTETAAPAPPPPLPPITLPTTTTTSTAPDTDPELEPCGIGYFGTVNEPETMDSYSLCTGAGWVYVNAPLITSGGCSRLGTVGPNYGQGPYTVCTPQGWVEVNRPVCADFANHFKGPDGFIC
ncbi:serine/threonine-protein kinase [Mycolicibacterium frederiksbergense]|uniref:non-specific serine/threonine protein kinase n=1 Tax=Mycolicibacterium frederiksbergense TaxID=117567 RepID=A0A6H0S2X1_9MYCO|nr:serine/threonine-protein kinase [Mycolicibacterium frederiksbergense]QIV80387.1 serine/threonine protein kinase [Mycolicibacterium frederiksbergense]